jgi:hypothetical protein
MVVEFFQPAAIDNPLQLYKVKMLSGSLLVRFVMTQQCWEMRLGIDISGGNIKCT